MAQGFIFDIYRGTTHDGPGLRSTVFFKGCPLNCEWCHNPEGVERAQRVWWEPKKCIGCLICAGVCPNGAITAQPDGIKVDPALCARCGACVGRCPSGGVSFTGRSVTEEWLVGELLKDRDYYNAFGGGVTASGGEAALQSGFVAAVFARLKGEGVHTALDTCGAVPFDSLAALLPYTDCLLYDLKLIDDAAHRRFTGASNALILENARRLAAMKQSGEYGGQLWIRTPLIPGATAQEDNLRAAGVFIRDDMGSAVERWELCAFNRACADKYARLGREWSYAAAPLITQAQAQSLTQAALSAGFDRARLAVTGILADGV